MCTVTWRRDAEGYDVLFNRDERHRRAPESPPAVGLIEDTAFLAPRDGDCLGTWLLVNRHGLTFCLLNDYADSWMPAPAVPPLSRGLLPLALAASRDAGEAWDRLRREELARRPPFALLVFSSGQPPARIGWRGGRAHFDPALRDDPPVSSSSWRPAEVVAARVAAYRRTVPPQPSASDLRSYHLSHDPARGGHSVRMIRPDAATRSLSHVRVDTQRATVHYLALAAAPDGGAGDWQTTSLARSCPSAATRE